MLCCQVIVTTKNAILATKNDQPLMLQVMVKETLDKVIIRQCDLRR